MVCILRCRAARPSHHRSSVPRYLVGGARMPGLTARYCSHPDNPPPVSRGCGRHRRSLLMNILGLTVLPNPSSTSSCGAPTSVPTSCRRSTRGRALEPLPPRQRPHRRPPRDRALGSPLRPRPRSPPLQQRPRCLRRRRHRSSHSLRRRRRHHAHLPRRRASRVRRHPRRPRCRPAAAHRPRIRPPPAAAP